MTDFSVAGGIGWSPDGRWIAAAHDATSPSSRPDETRYLSAFQSRAVNLAPIVPSQRPTMDVLAGVRS